jgi:voltage-gated potassium channel
MLDQLILATMMVVAIVLIHLCGLAILTRLLRSHSRMMRSVRIVPFTLLSGALIGIVAVHTVEIWLYAAAYLGLGAFRHFEGALYFSTSTYATIGYGDVLLPHEWRIFGAIEGPVGVIMLGLSTAYLVSLLARLKLLSHDWLALDRGELTRRT